MTLPLPGLSPEVSEVLIKIRAILRTLAQGSAYQSQTEEAKRARLQTSFDALMAWIDNRPHPYPRLPQTVARLAEVRRMRILSLALRTKDRRHRITRQELSRFMLDGIVPLRELTFTAHD